MAAREQQIIFITGTDTGVGKTLLTALLLDHLRERGMHALAIKPFCSGGRGDMRLLQSLQPGELAEAEMNPFYYAAPIAPLVAAGRRRAIRLPQALGAIRRVADKCDCLLIEGSGGLLAPLGPGLTAADLIVELGCRVIVVARNRLGTINHTLLTVGGLERIGIGRAELKIVVMRGREVDASSRTNPAVLRKLLAPARVMSVPFLGRNASSRTGVRRGSTRLAAALRATL